LDFLCSPWYALKKLIDRRRKRSVASTNSALLIRIINPNCIGDFFTTKDRFDLAFTLRLLTNTWRRRESEESQHCHKRQEGNQRVTPLATLA
jgi:hypothetical protein